MKNKKNLFGITFSITIFLWLILIFAQPLSKLFPWLSYTLPFDQIIFSKVCHQNPEKLINVGGQSFVCARCVGIYTGGFISSLLILFSSRLNFFDNKYLILSFIPVILDVGAVNLGIYSYSKTSALITGLILGSSVIYYFYKSIFSQLERKSE